MLAPESLAVNVLLMQGYKGVQASPRPRQYGHICSWRSGNDSFTWVRQKIPIRLQKRGRRHPSACQALGISPAETGAERAGEELETFETHIGVVEPVDEDEAEARHCPSCSTHLKLTASETEVHMMLSYDCAGGLSWRVDHRKPAPCGECIHTRLS